jgi:hypothetical protein
VRVFFDDLAVDDARPGARRSFPERLDERCQAYHHVLRRLDELDA